ncbi:MAG: GNAT family N-acetyltransferase [Candidatus Niameybacter stercoravium]|nr:GNAT family N-acetyltransferase [Candidatus Niameybacter stercoravium]
MMRERVLVIEENNHLSGWLRYNLFWDNTPFMNMLYILDDYRGKGYGKALTLFWEEKMKRLGYELVMTSTLSNEGAQHFYRKLGYTDAGSLLLPQEPLEIIFIKSI